MVFLLNSLSGRGTRAAILVTGTLAAPTEATDQNYNEEDNA